MRESWDWTFARCDLVAAARARQSAHTRPTRQPRAEKGKRCHFYCTPLVLDKGHPLSARCYLLTSGFDGRWFSKSVGRKANGQKTAFMGVCRTKRSTTVMGSIGRGSNEFLFLSVRNLQYGNLGCGWGEEQKYSTEHGERRSRGLNGPPCIAVSIR